MTLPPKLEKLLDNWPAKIISLVAAILVYAFYQISSLETRYFVIPLEVKQSAGMVSTSVSESSIRISIRGNLTEINSLEAKDFKAFTDMSLYVNEGTAVVPVQLDLSDNIRIMKDVEIRLSPETVEITLEKESTDYIPVKINYAGGAAHGYEIEDLKVVPPLIKVKGPRSLVENLKELETDVILFDELRQNVSMDAELLATNEKLQIEHEGPVTVEAAVVPSKMKRVIANLPVIMKSVPPEFEADADKKLVTITISGNELDIEEYEPSPNLIFTDCSEITETGEYDLPVQYTKSTKYNVDVIVPETVHVLVTEHVEEEADESGE